MGQLKDQMIKYMVVRGYSPKTITLYTSCVGVFARHFQKSPLQIATDEIESFFLHLRQIGRQKATVRIYFEAIRFFYRMHGLIDRVPAIRFPKERDRLPIILSPEEVGKLLSSCASLKYKTLFTVIYSAGLRISEALNLKEEDVDFRRKTIFVRAGKNGKDRYTVLADGAADLLHRYLEVYRSGERIFFATDLCTPISQDTVRRRFKELLSMTGLSHAIRVHTLRHCFATHLIENGTGLFHVMQLLGHANIQTTMVYLHTRSFESLGIVSPLDRMRRVATSDSRQRSGDLELISA